MAVLKILLLFLLLECKQRVLCQTDNSNSNLISPTSEKSYQQPTKLLSDNELTHVRSKNLSGNVKLTTLQVLTTNTPLEKLNNDFGNEEVDILVETTEATLSKNKQNETNTIAKNQQKLTLLSDLSTKGPTDGMEPFDLMDVFNSTSGTLPDHVTEKLITVTPLNFELIHGESYITNEKFTTRNKDPESVKVEETLRVKLKTTASKLLTENQDLKKADYVEDFSRILMTDNNKKINLSTSDIEKNVNSLSEVISKDPAYVFGQDKSLLSQEVNKKYSNETPTSTSSKITVLFSTNSDERVNSERDDTFTTLSDTNFSATTNHNKESTNKNKVVTTESLGFYSTNTATTSEYIEDLTSFMNVDEDILNKVVDMDENSETTNGTIEDVSSILNDFDKENSLDHTLKETVLKEVSEEKKEEDKLNADAAFASLSKRAEKSEVSIENKLDMSNSNLIQETTVFVVNSATTTENSEVYTNKDDTLIDSNAFFETSTIIEKNASSFSTFLTHNIIIDTSRDLDTTTTTEFLSKTENKFTTEENNISFLKQNKVSNTEISNHTKKSSTETFINLSSEKLSSAEISKTFADLNTFTSLQELSTSSFDMVTFTIPQKTTTSSLNLDTFTTTQEPIVFPISTTSTIETSSTSDLLTDNSEMRFDSERFTNATDLNAFTTSHESTLLNFTTTSGVIFDIETPTTSVEIDRNTTTHKPITSNFTTNSEVAPDIETSTTSIDLDTFTTTEKPTTSDAPSDSKTSTTSFDLDTFTTPQEPSSSLVLDTLTTNQKLIVLPISATNTTETSTTSNSLTGNSEIEFGSKMFTTLTNLDTFTTTHEATTFNFTEEVFATKRTTETTQKPTSSSFTTSSQVELDTDTTSTGLDTSIKTQEPTTFSFTISPQAAFDGQTSTTSTDLDTFTIPQELTTLRLGLNKLITTEELKVLPTSATDATKTSTTSNLLTGNYKIEFDSKKFTIYTRSDSFKDEMYGTGTATRSTKVDTFTTTQKPTSSSFITSSEVALDIETSTTFTELDTFITTEKPTTFSFITASDTEKSTTFTDLDTFTTTQKPITITFTATSDLTLGTVTSTDSTNLKIFTTTQEPTTFNFPPISETTFYTETSTGSTNLGVFTTSEKTSTGKTETSTTSNLLLTESTATEFNSTSTDFITPTNEILVQEQNPDSNTAITEQISTETDKKFDTSDSITNFEKASSNSIKNRNITSPATNFPESFAGLETDEEYFSATDLIYLDKISIFTNQNSTVVYPNDNSSENKTEQGKFRESTNSRSKMSSIIHSLVSSDLEKKANYTTKKPKISIELDGKIISTCITITRKNFTSYVPSDASISETNNLIEISWTSSNSKNISLQLLRKKNLVKFYVFEDNQIYKCHLIFDPKFKQYNKSLPIFCDDSITISFSNSEIFELFEANEDIRTANAEKQTAASVASITVGCVGITTLGIVVTYYTVKKIKRRKDFNPNSHPC